MSKIATISPILLILLKNNIWILVHSPCDTDHVELVRPIYFISVLKHGNVIALIVM